MNLTNSLRAEYARLFASCTVRPERSTAAHRVVDRIERGKARYGSVSDATGVPWWFVGVIHAMESSLDFSGHLHNGDPLTARTVRVPAGRPRTGSPPYSWEESAVDALTVPPHDLRAWRDWRVEGACYQAEKFNGWGYRKRGVPSPYLWAGSYHERPGRFVADGVWDADAVSQQIGAAVLLRLMVSRDLVQIEEWPRCVAVGPGGYACARDAGHPGAHRDEVGVAWKNEGEGQ